MIIKERINRISKQESKNEVKKKISRGERKIPEEDREVAVLPNRKMNKKSTLSRSRMLLL
jgi:hypothetical protein